MKKILLCGVATFALWLGYRHEKQKAKQTLYPKPVIKTQLVDSAGKEDVAYIPPILPVQNKAYYKTVSDIILQFQGTAQETAQLQEVLTTISKTKTGAQYIGNFPSNWILNTNASDGRVSQDLENKRLGISSSLLSSSDKQEQIEKISRHLVSVVLSENDPNFAKVYRGSFNQVLYINQNYAKRIAKDIMNESPYGDPNKVKEITLKDYLYAKRYPLPSKEDILAYSEKELPKTVSGNSYLPKLLGYGSAGIIAFFVAQKKFKEQSRN